MDKRKQNYDNKYIADHYARVQLLLPKEQKPIIEKRYKDIGCKNMSEYIKGLIDHDLNANSNQGG